MGGRDVEEGASILREAGIPTFSYPDEAVKIFNDTWRFASHLRQIYETPTLPSDDEHPVDRARARALIDAVRAEGRTLLTEDESKDLLAAYGIPITETVVAPTPDFYRWSFASMWTPGPFETKATRAYYYLTDAEAS